MPPGPHHAEAPSHPPHALGRRGESLAARYLERLGWTVMARNYRFGRREVDLVVRRDSLVAFVEVKSRAGAGFGSPLEAITWKKRREIQTVAAHFLATRPQGDVDVRFDAIAVIVERDTPVKIEYVPDAWRIDR